METIPIHAIAHQVPSGLYGGSGRDRNSNSLFAGHFAHGFDDLMIHLGLVVVVMGKSRMVGVAGIGPNLMDGKTDIGIGCMGFQVLQQIIQIGLVCVGQTGQLTHLLNGNVVPRLVLQGFLEGGSRSIGGRTFHILAVVVGRLFVFQVIPVSFQGASPDIEIADDESQAGCLRQFVQVFHAVVGEAVSDRQNMDDGWLGRG